MADPFPMILQAGALSLKELVARSDLSSILPRQLARLVREGALRFETTSTRQGVVRLPDSSAPEGEIADFVATATRGPDSDHIEVLPTAKAWRMASSRS